MENEINYIEISSSDFFKINQKIWEFFVCKMSPKVLKQIAKKDINRYENLDEIQRDLRKDRIKQIHSFIYEKEYATFPNTFIISVSDDTLYEDGILRIPLRDDEAYILDGQHRLSGFDNNEEEFEIIVSVFIGLSKFYQAMIFANINGEQVKVNKSLVRSLYWFSEFRTPEMVTYTIVKFLNEQDNSPWNNKIKMLWKWDGILSLSTFFDELLKQITPKLNWIFSSFYINDWEEFTFNEKDSEIYYILEDYYNKILEEFSEEWGNTSYILNKTTGFYWFFWLLIDLQTNNIDFSILNWIKWKIKPLTNENYKAGWVWQKALYNDLKKAINLQ